MELTADLLIIFALIVALFAVNRYMNQQQSASQARYFEPLLATQAGPDIDLEGRFADASVK